MLPQFFLTSHYYYLKPDFTNQPMCPLLATRAQLEAVSMSHFEMVEAHHGVSIEAETGILYIFRDGAVRITMSGGYYSFNFLDDVPEHKTELLEEFFARFGDWKSPTVLWEASQDLTPESDDHSLYAIKKPAAILQGLSKEDIAKLVLKVEEPEHYHFPALTDGVFGVIYLTSDDKTFTVDEETGLFTAADIDMHEIDTDILQAFRFHGPESEFAEKMTDYARKWHAENPTHSADRCMTYAASALLEEYGEDRSHLVDIARAELAARWIFRPDAAHD